MKFLVALLAMADRRSDERVAGGGMINEFQTLAGIERVAVQRHSRSKSSLGLHFGLQVKI